MDTIKSPVFVKFSEIKFPISQVFVEFFYNILIIVLSPTYLTVARWCLVEPQRGSASVHSQTPSLSEPRQTTDNREAVEKVGFN